MGFVVFFVEFSINKENIDFSIDFHFQIDVMVFNLMNRNCNYVYKF
jgi:hypothetical protein